ncbi:helix-turn-helix transcriptional regulator [Heyndrickxia oleronia]|uniref:helix-turn-helix transcriptional regulator n=1 Tax=Heyndrickxia oleronia TaxID=38875 RepID=UPI00203E1DFE|nr:helix-turn-helix transcriptional regulator [Heyndrickxia oleronia]
MKIILKDSHSFQKMLLLKGHSQRSFAKKLELSSPYVNQIISKKRNPSPKVAKKIAEILEVEIEDIFFITNANKSYQN